MMKRSAVASLALLSLLAACTRPTTPTEGPIRADDTKVAPTASVSVTATASVTATTTVDDAATTAADDVYCATSKDCDWDDPCMAKRCVAASKGFGGCDKSAPPPGTCTCIANRCTLRHAKKPPELAGCKADPDCGFVPSLGV
ncbi:MAG: hypothetical protein ABI175_22540, partial [Polyangiales bacterium]